MDDSRNEDNPGLGWWKSDLVGPAVCVWESENEVSQEDGRERSKHGSSSSGLVIKLPYIIPFSRS